MLSSQLFWRVFGVYAALTIGTALAFVVILTAQQRDAVRKQARQRVHEDAAMMATALRSAKFDGRTLTAEVRSLLDELTQADSSRFAVLDESLQILWSSHGEQRVWEHDTTPEVAAAVESGKGFSERPLTTADGRETANGMFYAVLIDPQKPSAGLVRVMLPLKLITDDLSAAHYQLWGAAATIGILALAITYVVVGRIIGPLETLTQAAQQIIEGKQPPELNIRSSNEIGTLAKVFNSMSRQLAARIGDLQEERQHLETNHQRLETVLGAMFEGVIAVDDEERILFANNAAIRLMDLKPTSMLGRPIWEAIRHRTLQELVRLAVSEGGLQRIEFDVARTQCTVAATASRLPGDPPPGVVIVIHDVTELRRLENLRRDFVQNVSHELKTPLSSISAYADTLLEGGLEDPDCNRQFVERISEQADRLHHLILDLLALARMESADDGFEVEPVDVTRVLSASIDAHAGVAQSKRITLVSEGPATPVWGLADDEGLRTIIDNLLDNAVNYTPAGGRITVRWKASGDRVTLQVQDTGVGIAREHQQRIFQRFYRIDKARSRELGGTGLGLSIVKHLCQVFGGTVSIASQLGQGSTFTVELRSADQLVAA